MRNGMKMLCAGVVLSCAASIVTAQTAPGYEFAPVKPVNLSLQPAEPESVYAPPSPARDDQGINQGAVHFDLGLGYSTDYVYRGVEPFESSGAEDQLNLQVDSKLSFDTGKLPHPFVAVFVNYADADAISSFQEIRPTLGAAWTVRPFVLTGGQTSYLYPNRQDLDTSEFWGKIQIDDAFFIRDNQPLLSPYVLGAYDYDKYGGWYFQAGVSHAFAIEEIGLTLTALAEVAYVHGFQWFELAPKQQDVNGFQHYQFGLVCDYSLNRLLNAPTRFGDWSFQAFGYFTDGLDNDLLSTNQIWGGCGIVLKY
jgi:hypothetical protein